MLLTVSPKKYYTFMIEPDQLATLKRLKARDGIAESEQIRRGITMWLRSKGAPKKRTKGTRKHTRRS